MNKKHNIQIVLCIIKYDREGDVIMCCCNSLKYIKDVKMRSIK